MNEHHGLAADARRCRFTNPQGQRGGDCSIDGIASLLQDLGSDFRRFVTLGRNHAIWAGADPLRLDDLGIAQLHLVRIGQYLYFVSLHGWISYRTDSGTQQLKWFVESD